MYSGEPSRPLTDSHSVCCFGASATSVISGVRLPHDGGGRGTDFRHDRRPHDTRTRSAFLHAYSVTRRASRLMHGVANSVMRVFRDGRIPPSSGTVAMTGSSTARRRGIRVHHVVQVIYSLLHSLFN